MKLIIDIPEYAYEHIREYYEKNDIVESTYSYIYHGTPIPDNATNEFNVIDKRTGKEPIFDHNHIFKEKWFKESGLIWCDIDGWYISEDGTLALVDDCGKVAYPPIDRFEIVWQKGGKE